MQKGSGIGRWRIFSGIMPIAIESTRAVENEQRGAVEGKWPRQLPNEGRSQRLFLNHFPSVLFLKERRRSDTWLPIM